MHSIGRKTLALVGVAWWVLGRFPVCGGLGWLGEVNGVRRGCLGLREY